MTIYNPVDLYYCVNKKTKPILTGDDTREFIFNKINEGRPFFAGRIGMGEASAVRVVEFRYKDKYEKICGQICDCAGFFPNDLSLMHKFAETEKNALRQVDLFQRLYARGENYLIDKYCCKETKYTNSIACWSETQSWTAALKGKKVLVVHPFTESIKMQYEKRAQLFPTCPDMLPEFELHTIKAVQTLAGQHDDRFSDWFEALDWMCEETTKVDYDVALIGCGAYGFPLGAFCKSQGKIAIHMGADVQMHFGILGERWSNHPWVKENINDNWVRPLEREKPQNANIVEGGCYW